MIVAVLLAVGGWLANSELDRRAKLRDLRIEYLLKAYRAFETASERMPPTDEHRRNIESAVADIQLLGTTEQARAAREFAERMQDTGGASATPLIRLLSEDLRKELLLDSVSDRPVILRFSND